MYRVQGGGEGGEGKTHSEHHAALLGGLAEASLLLIAPDALNVVPPVGVVGLVVRDVELAHRVQLPRWLRYGRSL